MIFVKNTPNSAGMEVYGDHIDFENLYEALHNITGDEYEFPNYSQVRLRVLGFAMTCAMQCRETGK